MEHGDVRTLGKHRLLCGDALELMRTLPEQSVDALVTDPPYCAGSVSEASRTAANGQGLRSENIRRFGWFVGDNMGTAGLVWLLRATAVEALRLVKPSGSLLCFCDWRMLASLQPAIESAGLRYQGLIVWDKGNMGLGYGFRSQHELIMHFTFGAPAYYNKGTPNVIRSSRVRGAERQHQTQKPVDLLRSLIEVVSPPDGLILDPYTGSGSALLAAEESGRRFIGIERDAAYCQTAIERYERLTQQPSLLDAV